MSQFKSLTWELLAQTMERAVCVCRCAASARSRRRSAMFRATATSPTACAGTLKHAQSPLEHANCPCCARVVLSRTGCDADLLTQVCSKCQEQSKGTCSSVSHSLLRCCNPANAPVEPDAVSARAETGVCWRRCAASARSRRPPANFTATATSPTACAGAAARARPQRGRRAAWPASSPRRPRLPIPTSQVRITPYPIKLYLPNNHSNLDCRHLYSIALLPRPDC